jgi:hypothetical protein
MPTATATRTVRRVLSMNGGLDCPTSRAPSRSPLRWISAVARTASPDGVMDYIIGYPAQKSDQSDDFPCMRGPAEQLWHRVLWHLLLPGRQYGSARYALHVQDRPVPHVRRRHSAAGADARRGREPRPDDGAPRSRVDDQQLQPAAPAERLRVGRRQCRDSVGDERAGVRRLVPGRRHRRGLPAEQRAVCHDSLPVPEL